MQQFYHSQINKLIAALNDLEKVTIKYINRESDLQSALFGWLDYTIQSYKEMGQLERESQLLLLKAEMVTAQRGINPASLEKVSTHRQEMQSNTAFKILQSVENILRNDLAVKTEKVRSAEELVRQVIIAGVQEGIISQEKISNLKNQSQLESLWLALSKDPNIVLGQARILLQVSKYDVWIMMGDLIARLKPLVPRKRTVKPKVIQEEEHVMMESTQLWEGE